MNSPDILRWIMLAAAIPTALVCALLPLLVLHTRMEARKQSLPRNERMRLGIDRACKVSILGILLVALFILSPAFITPGSYAEKYRMWAGGILLLFFTAKGFQFYSRTLVAAPPHFMTRSTLLTYYLVSLGAIGALLFLAEKAMS